MITIITVILNKDKDLEKTIKSVLLQKYENIEYIIIDGGSNGSVLSKIKNTRIILIIGLVKKIKEFLMLLIKELG